MVGDFFVTEHNLFAKRFANGYDLKGDERYNLWVSVYYPEENSSKFIT